MPSPLHATGLPWSGAADADGVALVRARREHQRTYPVLAHGDRARLVVLGCETFGRWDPEALSILLTLSAHKAEEAPELLRRSARQAWHKRWSNLISTAAQIALAESLMDPSSRHFSEIGGDPPALGDLLSECQEGPAVSRLH